jgi:hypothetical protein
MLSLDQWTIDTEPVDPMEPLTTRRRRVITWQREAWNSITSGLKSDPQTAVVLVESPAVSQVPRCCSAGSLGHMCGA